jgi:hypothetical protein
MADEGGNDPLEMLLGEHRCRTLTIERSYGLTDRLNDGLNNIDSELGQILNLLQICKRLNAGERAVSTDTVGAVSGRG